MLYFNFNYQGRLSSHICCGHRKSRNNVSGNNNDKNQNSYLLFEAMNVPLEGNHVSLYDVRDAVECCSGIMNERMRNECYVQFGVDGKMAEKYYKHIEIMERQYELPNDPIPTRDIKLQKKPRKWFPFHKDGE